MDREIDIKGIQNITAYAEVYKQQFLHNLYPDKNWFMDINNNLRFLFGHAYYQGRDDDLSRTVDEAAQNVFKTLIEAHGDKIFTPEKRDIVFDAVNAKIGKPKGLAGRGDDVGLTMGMYDYISEFEGKYRIIPQSARMIIGGDIKDHHKRLDEISRIGDKIACFYLRDVVSILNLDSYVTGDDQLYIQPIDTWVRKVAARLNITDKPKNDMEVKKDIIYACGLAGVKAHEFNMGAWMCGAKASAILLNMLCASQKSIY